MAYRRALRWFLICCVEFPEVSPMISFSCPTCREVIQVREETAGTKMPCPRCGQKLRVPSPADNPTVAGHLLPHDLAAGAPGRERTGVSVLKVGLGIGALAAIAV